MTSPSWDPQQYLRHEGPRTRPLADLLARVGELPGRPPRIADIGCGTGNGTALLAARWPAAHVTGYDSSAAMLRTAAAHAGPTPGGGRIDFARADLADWTPEPGAYDLILGNAVLQWVPDHWEHFPRWLAGLAPGGTFAFQVPGNYDAPSHALMRQLTRDPRWRERLRGVLRDQPVLQPVAYLELLCDLGCAGDAWETTYTHLLHGPDPVLDWVKGTGLRPVLDALGADADAFVTAYAALLRTAYPPGPHGTPFPFRRIFALGVTP
ncbi:trans-aconitate 2-methyltransferase [Streptomyces sp. WAC 06738]|uniref:trans-aconitate 2-methyltransferase n=1 Tax=Streptomyces sp. WAC 06738 TaxID=2203210 RepID=UPI000F6B8942|nr:trans-aconitate 2-methyltransferase [Streptomyces sp. WAC 06738]AZM46461.1 trans-aconitate 2-methyltransferase [Streptomyces sp. WAC 06738]